MPPIIRAGPFRGRETIRREMRLRRVEGDQQTPVPPAAVLPEARIADAEALEAALAAAPPEAASPHIGRFLAVAFLVIVLALVLIAATGDPYGAGCGGG